jgi:hypothetical protein
VDGLQVVEGRWSVGHCAGHCDRWGCENGTLGGTFAVYPDGVLWEVRRS